jgi:hypothetical protein
MEEYFKAKLKELHSGPIKIHEVHLDIIHSHNSLISDGYNITNFNDIGFVVAYIFIDINLSWEQKINVLFHEYGHVVHKQTLGNNEIMRIKRKSEDEWNVLAVFEAFKYQLNQIRIIAETEDISLLFNLMKRLEVRSKEDSELYKIALKKLMSENIWQVCVKLIQ